MASLKPVCKYGSSCYRKNPHHLSQYCHVGSELETASSSETKRSRRTDEEQSSPVDEITDCDKCVTNSGDTPLTKRSKLCDDLPKEIEPVSASTNSGSQDNEELTNESSDVTVRENIKRQFLVGMPEDFYQLWEFCKSLHPSQPEGVLKPSLGLELVGPYHVLGGRLMGVPWEKCVLHYRFLYDPPEFQTVMIKSGTNTDGYHIGYFRDDPKSTQCLVVSNCAEKGCDIAIEGDSLFSALRYQLADALKHKRLSSAKKTLLQDLSSKLRAFMAKSAIPELTPSVNDLWKQRNKQIVASCFHKIGIVVPYNKKTELGYRPLTMTDRELKRLLNKIANCSDEGARDKLSEPLQEIVTYVQFANDECDYGMGLELGLDLFFHGNQYFHTLIGHLLPVAYDLLQREQFGRISTEHLKQRSQLLDCTL